MQNPVQDIDRIVAGELDVLDDREDLEIVRDRLDVLEQHMQAHIHSVQWSPHLMGDIANKIPFPLEASLEKRNNGRR
jgi:hypothetical protein